MATSFFYIYVMATSFFFNYVMATSLFYIYIYIYIYKLTERPVVLLNAIFTDQFWSIWSLNQNKVLSNMGGYCWQRPLVSWWKEFKSIGL